MLVLVPSTLTVVDNNLNVIMPLYISCEYDLVFQIAFDVLFSEDNESEVHI